MPNITEAPRVKPIHLICATRKMGSQFMEEAALGRSLKQLPSLGQVQLFLTENNKDGLPVIYNRAIQFSAKNPAILVFFHDDVSICDLFWHQRIREASERFDVVGVPGNTRRSSGQIGWMRRHVKIKDDPEFLNGTVGSGSAFPCHVGYYGPAPRECKLLDGLMLIADSEKLHKTGLRFDEQFKFHFYDMDFCRQAELKGLRMGTWPLSVIHGSDGVFNSPEWHDADVRYLAKYGE